MTLSSLLSVDGSRNNLSERGLYGCFGSFFPSLLGVGCLAYDFSNLTRSCVIARNITEIGRALLEAICLLIETVFYARESLHVSVMELGLWRV
jgi:hypothetical protein